MIALAISSAWASPTNTALLLGIAALGFYRERIARRERTRIEQRAVGLASDLLERQETVDERTAAIQTAVARPPGARTRRTDPPKES